MIYNGLLVASSDLRTRFAHCLSQIELCLTKTKPRLRRAAQCLGAMVLGDLAA